MIKNIESDFNKLVLNGWLTENEAKEFISSEDICSAINCCTSPEKKCIFNALINVALKDVKVVILGQDPYPNPKHAHGFAFSSYDSSTPESLKNIFKAIDKAYGSNLFEKKHNVLLPWVEQNVLLLNTALTYQDAGSGDKNLQNIIQKDNLRTWKPFLDTVIKKILNVKNRKIVMLLWGNGAHSTVFRNIKNSDFKKKIHSTENSIVPETEILILQCSHPSPLSVNRGGNFPQLAPTQFLECDKYLGCEKINWINL